MRNDTRIWAAILKERTYQDDKYGPVLEQSMNLDGGGYHPGPMIQGKGGHELAAWLLVIEKELNEAKEAATGGGLTRTGRHTTRAELVQIAAVCVAALEQHGLEE